MNRKGFIRTIEVILAILLFLGFYDTITQDLTPELPKSDPTTSVIELFTTLEQTNVLNELINTYSMREILNNLKFLLPSNKGYNIELTYSEPLNVKNYNNAEVTANITFVKPFPRDTNIYSVKVFDESRNILPTQVVNNYYSKEITIQPGQSLSNETITLPNLHIQAEEGDEINESSFISYVNSERVNLTLNSISYNTESYDANASVTLLIPYASKGEVLNTFLFFAVNETSNTVDYPSLETGLTPPYTSETTRKSGLSEVRFTISLNPNEEHNAILSYELNTDVQREFPTITPNSSNVAVDYRDKYYESSTPSISYEPSSTKSIKKLIVTDEVTCLINLKMWDYE